MKKQLKKEWIALSQAIEDIPENRGTIFFEVPYVIRTRYTIDKHTVREPTITIHTDGWSSQQREWYQVRSECFGLSIFRELHKILEKELKDIDGKNN